LVVRSSARVVSPTAQVVSPSALAVSRRLPVVPSCRKGRASRRQDVAVVARDGDPGRPGDNSACREHADRLEEDAFANSPPTPVGETDATGREEDAPRLRGGESVLQEVARRPQARAGRSRAGAIGLEERKNSRKGDAGKDLGRRPDFRKTRSDLGKTRSHLGKSRCMLGSSTPVLG
jgi:hypothetical protein